MHMHIIDCATQAETDRLRAREIGRAGATTFALWCVGTEHYHEDHRNREQRATYLRGLRHHNSMQCVNVGACDALR
eukprot:8339257-Lingulodinium_polyedra.AAC.1